VTKAVHDAGGTIFLQLWHVGRVSDPVFLDGELPVAPSAIAAGGHVSLVRPKREYVTPRALELDEIPGIVAAYRKGAENAKRAGFDGVEVHGAIENRARLLLEVTDACIDVWGADRVGVHLAPRADSHTMGDSDRAATFGYVARELGKRKIAFIAAREHEAADSLGPQLKKAFGGVYIANEKFTKESAQAAIARGDADAVAWGQTFIANPDLVRRFEVDASLNAPDASTFYAPGPEGYTDYPMLETAE
jgi:2,4-dienoyl-CoA reductase-like NADH-dependent reductase (Old Yellow Enzyme family)